MKSGKNLGKRNETTIQRQAELELSYLYQKQIDSGYVYNIEQYVDLIRPQLAFKYEVKKHLVDWSRSLSTLMKDKLYASRKLNGIRCAIFIKNGKITFESRTGKAFKYFHHIANDINIPLDDIEYMFDGELFNKDIPFEVLCSLINSETYTEITYNGITYNTNQVEFHCYDFVDFKQINDDYFDRFVDNFSLYYFGDSFKVVSNVFVDNEDDMYRLAKEWTEDGYEGLMLRSGWVSYQFGRRTEYLLKVKLFESEEFKIKDIYLAENDQTKVMFLLYNHHNDLTPYNVFDCSVKGNKEYNLNYYQNKQDYINYWCTVSYQALSSYSVPLFAQVEVIRDGKIINDKFTPNY